MNSIEKIKALIDLTKNSKSMVKVYGVIKLHVEEELEGSGLVGDEYSEVFDARELELKMFLQEIMRLKNK